MKGLWNNELLYNLYNWVFHILIKKLGEEERKQGKKERERENWEKNTQLEKEYLFDHLSPQDGQLFYPFLTQYFAVNKMTQVILYSSKARFGCTVTSAVYQSMVFTTLLLLQKKNVFTEHQLPETLIFSLIEMSRGVVNLWNLVLLETLYNKSTWTL